MCTRPLSHKNIKEAAIDNIAPRSTKKENEDMEITIKKQDKQITAQRFVMNNLRNGIEYLKDHCKRDRTDGIMTGTARNLF